MSNKPQPIVREERARASVQKLVKGMADEARRQGQLPQMRAIEDFAREVTHDTIAKHEERFRNGVPDAKPLAPPPTDSPARLDQGPIDDALGVATKVERPFDNARLIAKRQGIAPLNHRLNAALVAMRLEILLHVEVDEKGKGAPMFPEWDKRIHDAWTQTMALAANVEKTQAERESAATDAVMNVLDQSDMVFAAQFGPWRHPKNPPRLVLAG